MCGIIGTTGVADSLRLLLDGLAALEYRGYDSAGVAVIDKKGGAAAASAEDAPLGRALAGASVWRVRAAEKTESVQRLGALLGGAPVEIGAGIGHTRWATHGAPTEANAHPHVDCTGRIALVHNGIIENYRELAEELDAAGHERTSVTDTEVLAHLVETELAAGAATLLEAVRRTVRRAVGDFAIAVVWAGDPDAIVVARRTSPLIVGRADGLGVVASDIAAVLATTRELYQLLDDEVAEVRPGSIRVVDAEGHDTALHALEVGWSLDAARKGGHPDFMTKEMYEQPRAVGDTLLGRVRPDGSTELEELSIGIRELAALRRVVLVACGSSYHAALVGRHALEAWARIPAEADIASEYRYRETVIEDGTLVVAISQSGETADSLKALRDARRRGATVLALTNVVDSLMAREADGVLYTRAGPEIGVASTKCHLAQLALLQCFALHLARARWTLDEEQAAEAAASLLALPGQIEATLGRFGQYGEVARRFAGVRNVYFLGRRMGYPVALEGALKLKELAYVRAEAYAAGEMKHGPISLIEPGSLVVVMATRTSLWEKVMANVEEVRARGATVLAVCEEGDAETA
ncbi:MAG TPA: glutamine--fructose-6-phosphate transaminase (isomerizing), partial [Acidimicrobiales bacterium]|nr:glutamine--fructose-6-phosphate transaminase (isomerizing) [Acidimicrobiales bacterium]